MSGELVVHFIDWSTGEWTTGRDEENFSVNECFDWLFKWAKLGCLLWQWLHRVAVEVKSKHKQEGGVKRTCQRWDDHTPNLTWQPCSAKTVLVDNRCPQKCCSMWWWMPFNKRKSTPWGLTAKKWATSRAKFEDHKACGTMWVKEKANLSLFGWKLIHHVRDRHVNAQAFEKCQKSLWGETWMNEFQSFQNWMQDSFVSSSRMNAR